jgi:hypothetical protein
VTAPLDRLRHGDFARLVGDVFRLVLPAGGTLELTLVEASEHRHLAAPGRRAGFSLVFRSGESGHLPQSIYRLEHGEIGPLDLFLVPIGPPREGGMCYEAVFN